jgi:dienelactone hydrolase
LFRFPCVASLRPLLQFRDLYLEYKVFLRWRDASVRVHLERPLGATRLKRAGKPAEFFRYDAKHGFMNEQRPDAHQRQAAGPAWSRTLGFWGKHL